MDLGPDSVHLWYAFSDKDGLLQGNPALTEDESRRVEQFIRPEARRRFILAHVLLRTALSSYAAVDSLRWRFSTGPQGKPEIASPTRGIPPLRFNLSHTAGLSACAVTLRRDVGVDVEMTERKTERKGIAGRFFSPEEAAVVEERPERFFDYWTLKESYIKACGGGLSMGLSKISFRLGDEGEASLAAGPAGWRFFRDAPSDRHVCAVAVREPDDRSLTLTVLRYPHPQD
jgi:4'-phosphopantetheinyl transferase